WFLIFDLPIDAYGQGFWLENRRFGVNWVPDPYRVGIAGGERGHAPEGLWASPAPEGAMRDPLVRAAAQRDALSPITRWRARLVGGTLDPTVPLGRDLGAEAITSGEQLDDEDERWPEPLEALATQREAQWQAAIA